MNEEQCTNTAQSDIADYNIAEPIEKGVIIEADSNLSPGSSQENDLPFEIESRNQIVEEATAVIERELYSENEDENEYVIHCERCDTRLSDDDYRNVWINGDTYPYCQRCIDDHCFYCVNCESYYLNDYYSIEYQGSRVCDACSSDYSYCDSCRRYVHYDDYNSDRDRCYDCRSDEDTGVEDYHESDDWDFIGDCLPCCKGVRRGLGIELEIDRDDRDTCVERRTVSDIRRIYNGLKFEYDGSLEYGFEIITHPHTVEAFYKIDWASILDVCRVNGYTSHNAGNCGLHIHFSRTMFGIDENTQSDNISKLIKFFEAYWGDILKVSRRTESQADQYAGRYNTTNNIDIKRIGKSKSEGRYYAINNSNHDTVEIRIMRGTLNVRSFLACIDFCICIVKNSRKIPWKDIWEVDKWLRGIKPETREYIRFRNAFNMMAEVISTSCVSAPAAEPVNFTEEVA